MGPTLRTARDNTGVLQGDPIGTNLLGGLTPFFALLGESFTNRYISQSVDFCDWISFAMIPTGVPYAAKALYRLHQAAGAERFTRSNPEDSQLEQDDSAFEKFQCQMEKDLLASTSKYVCQIWNGRDVERVITDTEMVREYIRDDIGLRRSKDAKYGTPDSEASLTKELKTVIHERPSLRPLYTPLPQWDNTAERGLPPNLQLNLAPYCRVFKSEILAAIGLFLQLSILALACVSAFHWPFFSKFFDQKPRAIRLVAFIFVASGTILLTAGLGYIAWAVNTVVHPTVWNPIPQKSGKSTFVVWIQRHHEHFETEGYVIGKRIDKELLSVHRALGAYQTPSCAYPILFITASGFLLQSVGLSMMHWPVQTLQFLSMIVMFIGRWSVRKQEAPDFAVRVKLSNFGNDGELLNALSLAENEVDNRRG